MRPPTVDALACGHAPTGDAGPGTGYAIVPVIGRVCYGCADSMAAHEIATAKPGHRMTFYVSTDGRTITSWSGGVLMRVARWGKRHPWSRERHYLTATDAGGRRWHGTGANGMWATLTLSRTVGGAQ